jgi:hypothetical protein
MARRWRAISATALSVFQTEQEGDTCRFFIAEISGHDIHQDQPKLVTEAIRQVVAGVRDPDTWYDLTSCCRRLRC